MSTPIPSKIVMLLAACIVCVPGASGRTNAGDKKPPHIAAVALKEFDASHEIAPDSRPKKAQTLKPRTLPGYDALASVLWSSGSSSVAALLANGADPNAKSKDGAPILNYAIWCTHREPIEDLLRAGADPNLADKSGRSPLHWAVWNGHAQTVALLVKYGADPNRKNKSGTTALEDARYHKNKDVIALLEAKPAKTIMAKRLELPKVLRRPDAVFGSARFRAAGGGQALVYTADSKQLIAGDEKGGLRFLDARTGELRNVIDAHQGTVLGLARIPNSPLVVSAGYDGTVRFWNIETAQELKRLRWGSKALAVSPDGRWLYTGYYLWQIESLEPLKLAPRGHVIKVADSNAYGSWSFFTPDNRYLVVACGGICVWDLEKESIRKIDKLNPQTVRAITWQDLAAVCDIGTARPTDLLALVSGPYQGTILTGSPQVLAAFAKKAPDTSAARALACSPDGQYVAALGFDSRIDVYDLESRWSKFKHDGHTAAVMAVCASPDGKLIASGGNDKTVRIWNRTTGEQLAEIPAAFYLYSVRFSPDSKLLAIGDNNSNIYLWDVKERSLQTYPGYARITDLVFAMGGERIVALGDELHLFDVKTRTMKVKTAAAGAAQRNLAISRQGVIVGAGRSRSSGDNFTVPEAWELAGDKLAVKWDLFSAAMGHRSSIHAVAFSPDGSLLAASSASAIRLWDMTKRQALGDKMCGHTTSVHCLRFSPDGKWLASCSWDGTARVWEVARGRQALVLDADVDRVSAVDFTPDGHLVTANWDGTVHQWNLPKHLTTPSAR